MASTTATPQGSVRQRNNAKRPTTPAAGTADAVVESLNKAGAKTKRSVSQPEYGVGLLITTILAFVTRFWGISHPNEVVFDEVHFGKVRRILILRWRKEEKRRETPNAESKIHQNT